MALVYAGLVPRRRSQTKLTKQQKAKSTELRKRATYLFDDLKDEEALVVLPTIALSELLVPVRAHLRGALIAQLSKRFHLHAFDNLAAAIAADIWSKHKERPADEQYENRMTLKADVMIVATAKSWFQNDLMMVYKHAKCRKPSKR